MINKIIQKNKGFTFLELIISFFVIIVGLIAVFSFAQYPVFYSTLSIQRLTATYLAQEGIEIIRNIRDTNWIEGDSWSNDLTDCLAGCQADYNDTDLGSLENDGLLYLDSNGLYNHDDDSGGQTKFRRKITIEPDGEDILKVKVIVEWQEKKKDYEVKVQENLYNWGRNF